MPTGHYQTSSNALSNFSSKYALSADYRNCLAGHLVACAATTFNSVSGVMNRKQNGAKISSDANIETKYVTVIKPYLIYVFKTTNLYLVNSIFSIPVVINARTALCKS